MKAVILDAATLGTDTDLSPLTALADFNIFQETHGDQIPERCFGRTIVLSNKVPLQGPLIEELDQLKYIGVLATGTNNIDGEAAAKAGIIVQNVQSYCSNSVAQHWLALALALAGHIPSYHQDVFQGRWGESPFFCRLDYPIVPLNGKRLGLVGYGELGQAVADLANRAFAMELVIAERPGATNIRPGRVSFETMLETSDIVSLHCPLTPETKGLMNAETLRRMKPHAFLINTARGDLVVEEDLLQALEEQRIAGAALDVISQEPPRQDLPIVNRPMPNLIVTPHIAWASREGRQNLINKAAESLNNWIHQYA